MAGFSKYPSQIDSSLELPLATDNVTPVKAEVVNRLRDAILAIESELGIDPSREFGTVRDRLDSLGSGSGGGAVEILQDGSIILPSAISLDFIGNVNITIPQPLRARIEVIGGQATQVQETLSVTSDGQASFTLSQNPIQGAAVIMFVNGIKQQYGAEYSVVDRVVVYNSGVILTTTDQVEFWYTVDIGSLVDISKAKIRVFPSAIVASDIVNVNKNVTWDSVSSLVVPNNASLDSDTFLITSVSGHFLCHGLLSIQSAHDVVTGVIIETVLNNTTVINTTTYNITGGSFLDVGVTISFAFSCAIDLSIGDALSVRWKTIGSGPSTTQVMAGDSLSWFGLSEI